MDYKRIETYVGHTCNQKCTYCMEYPNMERAWNEKITKYDILKKLIKYKKRGYNHVTYLGGEPFIQSVFLDALNIGKKLGYTILVTTNATTLHIESQAEKFLPQIDELILSVQAIDKKLQQKISRTNVYVKWEEVFENINKYWKGTLLKVNIVITKDNLGELLNIVKYIVNNGIKNIAITYPDLDFNYYGIKHLKSKVAPTYSESIKEIVNIDKYLENFDINLKIVDFPFCVFPKSKIEKYINKTDEIDYGNRIKIGDFIYEKNKIFKGEINREIFSPRERELVKKCSKCKYNKLCWGPAIHYKDIYGYSEINPIKNV